MGIICCCEPIEDKEEKKEKLLEELERIYDNIPKYFIKMLLGDFNARIGRKSHKNQF